MHCSNGIQTAPKAVHSAIQQQSRENCLKTLPVIPLTNKQIDRLLDGNWLKHNVPKRGNGNRSLRSIQTDNLSVIYQCTYTSRLCSYNIHLRHMQTHLRIRSRLITEKHQQT